jgi:hypothetical protein
MLASRPTPAHPPSEAHARSHASNPRNANAGQAVVHAGAHDDDEELGDEDTDEEDEEDEVEDDDALGDGEGDGEEGQGEVVVEGYATWDSRARVVDAQHSSSGIHDGLDSAGLSHGEDEDEVEDEETGVSPQVLLSLCPADSCH